MANKPQFEYVVVNAAGFQGLPYQAVVLFSSRTEAQPFVDAGDIVAPRVDVDISGLPDDKDDGGEVASAIFYQDSAPLLGASTVQGAIDTLKNAAGALLTKSSRANLSALSVANLTDNIVVCVSSTTSAVSFWRLRKTSTATVDGINVLSATTGRWIRVQFSIYEFASQNWNINSVTGDDEADGAVLPIKTWKEWFARTQAEVIGSPTFTIDGGGVAWPSTDRVNYALKQRDPNGSTSNVTVVGTRIQVATGALTAISTNPVNTAGGETATITDAARTWVVDQLVIFANGAFCFVLADIGGGVAQVTPFTDLNGAAVAVPPSGNAYTIYTLPQIIFELTPSGDNAMTVQDIQNTAGIRTLGRTIWKRCLFSQVSGYMPNGFFIGCQFSCGAQLVLGRNSGGEVWPGTLKFAMCGFRNSPVLIDGGLNVEFQSVVCKGGAVTQPLVKVGTAVSAALSPPGGTAVLSITGNWGLGILNGPSGGLDVNGDAIVFVGGLTLQLWGKTNATFGTRVGASPGARVRIPAGVTPTLASTGTELLFPANPIPALSSGAVPASAACTTYAAWAAPPFSRFAQTLDLQTSVASV